MSRYASKTDVSSVKSRNEIERTLTRYDADQFIYGWQEDSAVVGFRMNGRQIKFILPLPSKGDEAFTHYRHSSGQMLPRSNPATAYEQAVRQKWRALLLIIKAKLEAVESGITEFDEEFLAHIVLPNGRTVGEFIVPQIESAYETGTMPALLPAPGKKDED